jgi:hypothetical protein
MEAVQLLQALRWSHAGTQYRRSAKTRNWEQAEKVKQAVEDQFSASGKPVEAIQPSSSRKTMESHH